MSLVAQGLTNGEVGRALGIGPDAVARALRSVADKLGTTGRLQTALEATRATTDAP